MVSKKIKTDQITVYKMISSIEPVLMKNVGFENYWSFRVLK
jgi:hypothetical protein